jgi:hypothetical protein
MNAVEPSLLPSDLPRRTQAWVPCFGDARSEARRWGTPAPAGARSRGGPRPGVESIAGSVVAGLTPRPRGPPRLSAGPARGARSPPPCGQHASQARSRCCRRWLQAKLKPARTPHATFLDPEGKARAAARSEFRLPRGNRRASRLTCLPRKTQCSRSACACGPRQARKRPTPVSG